jgi:hypothetical protein
LAERGLSLPAARRNKSRHLFVNNQMEFIIMTIIGVFFTLQGYEVISIGKQAASADVRRLEKWQQAQRLYRWLGPVATIGGLALWMFSR